MHAELGLPVRVENDANLGALAETVWGAGRGCADLVYASRSASSRSRRRSDAAQASRSIS
jgi:ROK family